MTGNVLKRLREAYGLTHREVEKTAGLYANAMRQAEAVKVSWRAGSKGGQNLTRYQTWRKITAALRARRNLQRKNKKIAPVRKENQAKTATIPRGTTHMLDGEPVRVVMMHGARKAFRHDGKAWVRCVGWDSRIARARVV